MAFIRKRIMPSGKVAYTVVFNDARGRRRERAAGSTKKAAENLKVRIERELAEGIFEQEEEEELSFAGFCDMFLAAKKAEIRKSTWADYELTIRKHMLPFFGEDMLSDIGPVRIQQMLAWMGEMGVSSATQGKVIRYVKVIFRKAVSLELIDRDPCRAVKAPRVERKEMGFLEAGEASRLLDASSGGLRPLFAVAAYAGLRLGEIISMQWGDIDFDRNIIRVNRSWRPESGFTSPKTPASRRSVPMIKSLEVMLWKHYLDSGKPGPDSLVFPNSQGKPRDRHRLSGCCFQETLQRAGLKRIRFHDLRHTFASLMIESGCDPKTLQVIMGHSSIGVTMNTYAHLYSTAYERAAANLEALVSGKPRIVPLKGGADTVAERSAAYEVNGEEMLLVI